MYEELVKRLRSGDELLSLSLDRRRLIEQAADAIEELSKQVELEHQSGFADGQIAANRKKPRWIPVTERLPEEELTMFFEKLINREVDRRLHEETMRREIWERLDRQQKQIEELRFTVECMKHENDCVKREN